MGRKSRLIRWLILVAALLAALYFIVQLILPILGTNNAPFTESFDDAGTWVVGEDANGIAAVQNGQYEIVVNNPVGVFLGTNGELFANGTFELTATQLGGPVDNGYGLVLRADSDEKRFYMFEISGDGFVWAGYCVATCDNQGWLAAPAVNQGSNAPNKLRVIADGSTFTFYVNDVEVTQFTDATLARGEIGVLVETFGAAGVRVAFDDFVVTPLN